MMMILREMEVLNEKQVLLEIGFQKVHINIKQYLQIISLVHTTAKKLVKSNFLIFRWKISPRKRKISFVCSAWMPMGSQSFNFEKNEKSRKCYIPKCGSFRKIPSWLAF